MRRLVALVAAWGFVLAGPALVGPATPVVLGHSQLVTSVPAAGDVAAASPTEIRLVFSEPIEPAYTKLDLIGPDGATIASSIGDRDPRDQYTLVAPVSGLGDGVYMVNWRALSAADGHTTSGFFTFGVGDVSPPAQNGGSTVVGGSIHAGHDATTAFLETESRIVGDLGLLLAFGLPIIGWLVLRDLGAVGLAKVVAIALGLAAIGAGGLLVLGSGEVGSDLVTFATSARAGQLLAARFVLALLAVIVVWMAAPARPRLALLIGGLAGLVTIVLLTVGSHAAGFGSPSPAVAIVVHLMAAGVWLSGLLVVAWLAIAGGPPERSLVTIVPRFSALALVAVGLIGLTGVYADWVHTRTLVSLETPYSTTLLVKAGLALTAFAIGGLNYRSGGRDGTERFRPRVALEAGLALAVVIATGVLASGSPPSAELPVAIAPAASTAASAGPSPSLELAPGRPGPTRFVVTLDAAAAHDTVELQLQRLDQPGGSRLTLTPVAGRDGQFAAGGGLLPAGSRWDASVTLRDHAGAEQSRTRFSFALDATGVSEGRATPVVDPALVVAVILLVAAALGLAFGLGGGVLPRVEPAASRAAVVAGSVVGALLGVTILVGGLRL
jgi:methionine-rich copper-binding protein CopC/putative copper export protein